jgi:hypothetical protein
MANHHAQGDEVHHAPFDLDALNWPTIGVAVVMWPWLSTLWAYVPGPTALYMVVSAGFMLFQMSDKLGWLERFKRRKLQELPDNPES